MWRPALLLLLSGCFGRLELEGEGALHGGPFDEQRASALWIAIEERESWAAFAGHEGFFENGAPHGPYGTLHVNPIAAADPSALPIGSILVSSEYDAGDAGALRSISAIERVDNFNPEAGDWFWARFAVDGELELDEDGVPLAGAVGMNGDRGCIPCHQSAPGGDFVFLNEGSP